MQKVTTMRYLTCQRLPRNQAQRLNLTTKRGLSSITCVKPHSLSNDNTRDHANVFSSGTLEARSTTTFHPILLSRNSSLRRTIHSSVAKKAGEPLIIGVGLAAIAYGGKVVLQTFDRYQEAAANQSASKKDNTAESEAEQSGSPGANAFSSWFSSLSTSRFYEGGFEDKMTRREAALILGVRETSPKDKILKAHRKLAMLNHPDAGGSTFLAAKLNEAKEKLLGGS